MNNFSLEDVRVACHCVKNGFCAGQIKQSLIVAKALAIGLAGEVVNSVFFKGGYFWIGISLHGQDVYILYAQV